MLVFCPHSFVDLITNSSSELFVCNSDKTLEAFREFLTKLVEMHQELSGESTAFEDMFQEPWIADKNDYRDYEGYGVMINKGDILLRSADDNSIPWAIVGLIESYIPCQRYHLG